MKRVTLSIAAVSLAAFTMAGVLSCNKKDNAPAQAASQPAAEAPKPAAQEAPAAEASNNALIDRVIDGIFLNANDLEQGVISTTVLDEASGFTLNATEEKVMEVKKCDARTVGSDLFTQAISTKGSGKVDYRNISFPAKAGDSIIVYVTSSSKTDSRPLHVVNVASGEEIGTVDMMPDNGKDVTVEEVKVAEDGTYCVYATSGTGYIYQIKVGK